MSTLVMEMALNIKNQEQNKKSSAPSNIMAKIGSNLLQKGQITGSSYQKSDGKIKFSFALPGDEYELKMGDGND